MKAAAAVISLLMVGCISHPYSDFCSAIEDVSEENLKVLDGSGREGGLLLISLLETDLKWGLQDQGVDRDPVIVVKSGGHWNPGAVPYFEGFTPPHRPVKQFQVVLRNPWAVLWAVDREKERSLHDAMK